MFNWGNSGEGRGVVLCGDWLLRAGVFFAN